MGSALRYLTASTIASRLAAVLVVPLAGLLVFGALAVSDDRHAVSHARELRAEAQRVELLTSAAVAFAAETDAIAGWQEVAAFGFDVDDILGGLGETEEIADSGLDMYMSQIAAADRSVWADADAVDRLRARYAELDVYRDDPAVSRPGFNQLRLDLADASDRALTAQVEKLDVAFRRVESNEQLTVLAQSMGPSQMLLALAREERTALAGYVLPPLSPEADDGVRYRTLVGTSAQFELMLAELASTVSAEHREQLAAAEASSSWTSFAGLRDDAIAGDVTPVEDFSNPIDQLATGLILFSHGFSRTQLLLDIDSDIKADFAAGAAALEAEAQDRQTQAVLSRLLLSLATLAASFLVIRSITMPVHALWDRARRITAGDLATTGPRRGPTDIRLVHRALDDMSRNLRTLSDQTEALSAGRLDDVVLTRQVAGPLGASVHGSVARLRSMTSRLEYEATHDALTGLPNRSALLSLLETCLSGAQVNRTPLAVIMLDLDGFKSANDDMGHAVGDEVLIHVSQRLQAQATGGFVARLGGDEFMIVLTGPDSNERVEAVAERAIAAVGLPMSVSAGTIVVSASAGVVHTDASEWLPPSEVLRRVDLAMYEAKADTPGEIVRFDQRLHDSLLETTYLQGEIRRALSQDEFNLHLQPIFRTVDGTVSGFEALLRWHPPGRDPISPALFVPVAEQTELVTQIDNWVIGRAGQIMSSWRDQPDLAPLTLSINISARHLSRPELVSRIERVIDAHDLPADRYVIEVTESQLIPNLARAEDTLRRLKALGVKLAIDDFGTGYASVAHLRRVQFDRLKIDQSFLANLDDETDRSLTHLLVSVGRNLHLEVVAEGIETAEQMEWATEAGCTHAQGFHLGRPKPVEEAIREARAAQNRTEPVAAAPTGRSAPRG
ncbi:MAG: sensor domain-containing phosphodiesterase [Actinomycetota bacterium]